MMTVAAVGLLYCGVSVASPILFAGSSGDRSASAEFAYTEADQKLTLTIFNTASGTIKDASKLLTGVYFSFADPVALTPESGTLAAGSMFVKDDSADPDDVAANWGYASGFSYNGTTQGVSAAGMGLFHNGSFGCGSDCENLHGASYGLVPLAYVRSDGNGSLKSELINNGVTLTFANVSSQPVVQNVWFQYGTNLNEGGFSGVPDQPLPGQVPEPAAIVLMALGLVGVGIGRRYRPRA